MQKQTPFLLQRVDAPDTSFQPPPIELRDGRYLARFARTPQEKDAVLKMRFEIFNRELGEGLASSEHTGRDQDKFDEICHHLIIRDQQTNDIVGTYRLQTSDMATAAYGFYSAQEFDFTTIPDDMLIAGVELGRAAITRPHRKTNVLFLLWKGLLSYLMYYQKRYLFGCCSLTSQNTDEGHYVLNLLKKQGAMHPFLFVPPMPGWECQPNERPATNLEQVRIPKLFRIYLLYGAKACGPPAIDRQFKTIDYLVLLDAHYPNKYAKQLIDSL
jgi:putative hemolysin